MEQLSQEVIRQRVCKTIHRLVSHDMALLKADCNERSITHRLAMYLQEEFERWDVDCEYNRDVCTPDTIKRLQSVIERTSASDTNAKTVFPDIIVHHRRKPENLLVIEVKKSTNRESDEPDMQKLRAFQEQLCYRFALFLRFNTGSDFQEGQKPLKVHQWL